MTVNVEEIVLERLSRWSDKCIDAHATPALLMAFGHDHANGEIHIYVPDDPLFTTEQIKAMLRLALSELG